MFRSILVVLFLACSTPSFAGYINHQFTMQRQDNNEIWAFFVEVNEDWYLPSRNFTAMPGQDEYTNAQGQRSGLDHDFGSGIGNAYGLFSEGRIDYMFSDWSLTFNEDNKLSGIGGFAWTNQTNPFYGGQLNFFAWGPNLINSFNPEITSDNRMISDVISHGIADSDGDSSVTEPASFGLFGLSLALLCAFNRVRAHKTN
ncbi:MAG: hypothetical protein V4629_02950 [Pseudomonadota bacterium]